MPVNKVGPYLYQNALGCYIDFSNRKSFAGANTTNYAHNVDPWTVNGVNTDITSLVGPNVPEPAAKTWKFRKTNGGGATGNQWNGWEGSYGTTWTGSAGDIWTTSYWYKTLAPAGITNFGVGAFYTSDWSRAYNTTVLETRDTIIADGEWHFNYTVTQFNEAYTNAIIVDGPSWGYSTSQGELWINGLQWTKTSYATRYIPGTYTAGTAVNDLTGKRTVAGLNLTYPAGKRNYIDYPYLNSAGTTVTVLATDSSNILNSDTHSIFFTIRFNSTAAYPTGATANWDKIFAFTGGGSDRSPGIWRWYNNRVIHWRYDPNNTGVDFGTAYSDGTTNPFALDTWYYVGLVKNGGTVTPYVNGVSLGSTTGISNPKTSGASSVYLFPGFELDLASIGLIQIYSGGNKVLTAADIFLNFCAIRGRYGI